MSNDLVAFESAKLPAYLSGGVVSVVSEAALAGMSSGAVHPRISLKAARFRIIEDGSEEILNVLALNAVVVGANPAISKIFFDGAYDPEEAIGPICFSEDGIKPDSSVAQPQNNLCATCPKNAWGSKITPLGAEVKACGDLKRLAVVSADDVGGTVYELVVTPAAFASWRDHVKKLQNRSVPIEAAITTLSFDPSASFPKLQFAFGGFLSDADYQLACKAAFDPKVNDITRRKSGASPKAANAPAQAPVAPPVAPTPPPPPPAAPTPPPAAASGFGKKGKKATSTSAPAASAPAAPAAPPSVSMEDLEKELAAFSQSDD